MIVMVSSMGDMWLDEAIANKLAQSMKSNAKYVTLNGNIIAVNSIRALLKPEDYKLMVVTRKQNWVCRHGNAHSPTDNCFCGAELKPTNAPQLEKTNPLTPEQQAEKDRRASAHLAWLKKFKHDMKNPDFRNAQKREEFVKNYNSEGA